MKKLRPFERNNPQLDRKKKPSAAAIAWCAGFWEGEGSVGVNSTINISATQKDIQVLERLCLWWGGRITLGVGTNRDIYIWQLSSYRAIDFAKAIWPFLSRQRKAQLKAKWVKGPAHLQPYVISIWQ